LRILTGGKLITEEVGLKLDGTNLEDLGVARKVISTKTTPRLLKAKAMKKMVKDRVAQIRKLIEQTTVNFDRRKITGKIG